MPPPMRGARNLGYLYNFIAMADGPACRGWVAAAAELVVMGSGPIPWYLR